MIPGGEGCLFDKIDVPFGFKARMNMLDKAAHRSNVNAKYGMKMFRTMWEENV